MAMNTKVCFLLLAFFCYLPLQAMDDKDSIIIAQQRESKDLNNATITAILTGTGLGWTAAFVAAYLQRTQFRHYCTNKAENSQGNREFKPIYAKLGSIHTSDIALLIATVAGAIFTGRGCWECYKQRAVLKDEVLNHGLLPKVIAFTGVGALPGLIARIFNPEYCFYPYYDSRRDEACGLEVYVEKHQGEPGIPSVFNGRSFARIEEEDPSCPEPKY
jgi:hypothetical protein